MALFQNHASKAVNAIQLTHPGANLEEAFTLYFRKDLEDLGTSTRIQLPNTRHLSI